MATASDIIDALGGPAELARAADLPLTTVVGWRDANYIPEWRQPAIAALAKGKRLPPFPTKAQRVSRARPAAEQALAS